VLALAVDVASSDGDISISQVGEGKELARAGAVELGGVLCHQSSAADDTAGVRLATAAHLEEIASDLDGHPVLAPSELATSLDLSCATICSGTADHHNSTCGLVASKVDVAAC